MNKHADPINLAALHTATRHDSGPKHVTGTAEYIDDMAEPAGTLHAYLALSERAHAEIVSVDLGPVRAAPGPVAVRPAPPQAVQRLGRGCLRGWGTWRLRPVGLALQRRVGVGG